MSKTGGCNNCIHPTCPHSLTTLGICRCDDCERGVLVLDLTSAPKSHKLVCNFCDVIINIFKNASKVSLVDGKMCDDCNAPLLTVVYKEEKSKFKDGAEEKTGCIFCTQEFTRLVEKSHAVTARLPHSSAGGGRGGRGRRGGGAIGGRGAAASAVVGGGGRGGKQPRDKMTALDQYFV